MGERRLRVVQEHRSHLTARRQRHVADELEPHALALQQQEELPRVALGGTAGSAGRAEERLASDRGRQHRGLHLDVADVGAFRAPVRIVVELLVQPRARHAELVVRALLQTNATAGCEAHAGRQIGVDVLQLGLPDRIVGVIRVVERDRLPVRSAGRWVVRIDVDLEIEGHAAATRDRQIRLQEVLEGLVLPPGVCRGDGDGPRWRQPGAPTRSAARHSRRAALPQT